MVLECNMLITAGETMSVNHRKIIANLYGIWGWICMVNWMGSGDGIHQCTVCDIEREGWIKLPLYLGCAGVESQKLIQGVSRL